MTHVLITALLIAAPVEIDVATRDGTVTQGRLISANEQELRIETDSGVELLETDTIGRLDFGDLPGSSDRQQPSTLRLVLQDGTELSGTNLTSEQEQIQLDRNDSQIVIPQRHVRWIRFAATPLQQDQPWQQILQDPVKADVIVVRRSSGKLRAIEGVIKDIQSDVVWFALDGDPIDVDRERVEGLLYFQGNQGAKMPGRCQVVTVDGSRWHVRQFSMLDGTNQLEIITPNGIQAEVPLEEIRSIDFASAATKYLSDLEPVLIDVQPFIAVPALEEETRRLRMPEIDRGFLHETLQLASARSATPTKYKRGIALYSRTLLRYRLAGKYRQFSMMAGIEQSPQSVGNVELVIAGDGIELLRTNVVSGDAAIPINLDISGVNRLEILVDYGDGGDIGDRLLLCNARLLK